MLAINMEGFKSKWHAEWQLIRGDFWLKALLFWLPPLLFLAFWYIFSASVASDVKVGVVDLDKSAMSRQLVRYYDANSVIAISDEYDDVASGTLALRGGEIYALIVVPVGLEKKTIKGFPPQVTAFTNGQVLLVAKLVNSALMQAHGTFSAGVDLFKNMANSSPEIKQAFAKAVPIRGQISPLFNSNSNYGHFLVTAAIPAIWQIVIVVTAVLALNASIKAGQLHTWLNGTPILTLTAKLLPYTLLHLAMGVAFLIFMYDLLGWPMHGSWLILLLGQLLMIIACQGVGSMLFLIFKNASHAMSLASGYTAPAFAFMGVTFPSSDMPLMAQIWRNMLPVSHYVELQIMQANYAATLMQSLPQLVWLGALFTPLCAAFVLVILTDKANQHQSVEC
ncbi:ABC transporter permease [Corallincola luteus]|uniref:ABC transporter permease n=1 Tax=Corallincola luteus TaxID=1775177 RepID=A0ABY2AJZ7_9GAMM|nr:ABC transporter permease [Corallincola luteus]TCI03165.1 ABC transporter permease [Corallincola luteus]